MLSAIAAMVRLSSTPDNALAMLIGSPTLRRVNRVFVPTTFTLSEVATVPAPARSVGAVKPLGRALIW